MSIAGHHQLLFLLGRGNGDFVPFMLPAATPTERLIVGDLNSDGKPDVIATGNNSNYVFTMLNSTP